MRRSLLGGALFSSLLITTPIALHATTNSAGGVNTMLPQTLPLIPRTMNSPLHL